MARYGYFWGCYVQGRLPHLEKSTRLVMERLGVDCGDLDGLTCCPEKTMVRTMGGQAWLLTAARNLAVGDEAGVDFVTPCPGCFATLKGAAAEVSGRADVRAEVARELEAVGRSYRGGARPRHVLEVLYEDVRWGTYTLSLYEWPGLPEPEPRGHDYVWAAGLPRGAEE